MGYDFIPMGWLIIPLDYEFIPLALSSTRKMRCP